VLVVAHGNSLRPAQASKACPTATSPRSTSRPGSPPLRARARPRG
jgi:hypothetical protein